MPEYRLYIMDRDQHIVGLVGVLTCASDQEAVERTERLRESFEDLELWQAERCVARIGDPYGVASGSLNTQVKRSPRPATLRYSPARCDASCRARGRQGRRDHFSNILTTLAKNQRLVRTAVVR